MKNFWYNSPSNESKSKIRVKLSNFWFEVKFRVFKIFFKNLKKVNNNANTGENASDEKKQGENKAVKFKI
jgi:hypothetical protein